MYTKIYIYIYYAYNNIDGSPRQRRRGGLLIIYYIYRDASPRPILILYLPQLKLFSAPFSFSFFVSCTFYYPLSSAPALYRTSSRVIYCRTFSFPQSSQSPTSSFITICFTPIFFFFFSSNDQTFGVNTAAHFRLYCVRGLGNLNFFIFHFFPYIHYLIHVVCPLLILLIWLTRQKKPFYDVV